MIPSGLGSPDKNLDSKASSNDTLTNSQHNSVMTAGKNNSDPNEQASVLKGMDIDGSNSDIIKEVDEDEETNSVVSLNSKMEKELLENQKKNM